MRKTLSILEELIFTLMNLASTITDSSPDVRLIPSPPQLPSPQSLRAGVGCGRSRVRPESGACTFDFGGVKLKLQICLDLACFEIVDLDPQDQQLGGESVAVRPMSSLVRRYVYNTFGFKHGPFGSIYDVLSVFGSFRKMQLLACLFQAAGHVLLLDWTTSKQFLSHSYWMLWWLATKLARPKPSHERILQPINSRPPPLEGEGRLEYRQTSIIEFTRPVSTNFGNVHPVPKSLNGETRKATDFQLGMICEGPTLGWSVSSSVTASLLAFPSRSRCSLGCTVFRLNKCSGSLVLKLSRFRTEIVAEMVDFGGGGRVERMLRGGDQEKEIMESSIGLLKDTLEVV
ncbi:hypothetical protein F2Q69_00036782 [Brassica cretica]|uniref:Uncharacterized protein n=1 Tax=Brassica cretica TaxID=69181 RepID=A0A8S9SPY8_BRACR|nr:hypothetical protein F2Q69_00036782 [Brassica cretica]